MPTDTGLEEIALQNLQGSKSVLRKDDELPTREEVIEVIRGAYMAASMQPNPTFGDAMNATADALIARGWLKVRES